MISLTTSVAAPMKIMVDEEDSNQYIESTENKDAETDTHDASSLTGQSHQSVLSYPSHYNDEERMLEDLCEEESGYSDTDRSLSAETYSSSSDPCNPPNLSAKEHIFRFLRQKLNKMTTRYSKIRTEAKYLQRRSSVSPLKATKQNAQILGITEKKYIKQWANILGKLTAMKETKFFGMSQEFMLEELDFEQQDYEVIFGNKGRLVQPRPDYKPKSSIIIREFPTWRDIQEVFSGVRGHGLSEIVTVNVWKGKHFRQQCEAKVDALTVWYHKPKRILRLKFKCERLWLDE